MSVYIINALRTPIGSFGGQLACFRAPELGAKVIKSLTENINLDLNSYDQVIMGNVLSAGLGQAPARQAAILGGLNVSTECLTCLLYTSPSPRDVEESRMPSSA